ncbi:hypothetical protein DPMN_116005 [Dreissena polymorpha]|uniref:Uncharacterized protein n=1 Tax=Dreissena polymorpha TaxID=45954 RepID=A0A9D4KN50_DREPO|nr:hypothetical protein DPMN_116005 [Dreissena polymorpha]
MSAGRSVGRSYWYCNATATATTNTTTNTTSTTTTTTTTPTPPTPPPPPPPPPPPLPPPPPPPTTTTTITTTVTKNMSNDTTAFCVRFFVAAFCYGLTNAYQGFRRQHFRDKFIVQKTVPGLGVNYKLANN